MSADTANRVDLDPDYHSELEDMVAAMNMAANRLTPPNGYRTTPHRLNLSDRKLSLQERSSYQNGVTPRIARRPTIESKRVSISDGDVSWEGDFILLQQCYLKLLRISGVFHKKLTKWNSLELSWYQTVEYMLSRPK